VHRGSAEAMDRSKDPKPATTIPAARKVSSRLLPPRDLLAKVALELFIVFVGVSAAFAVDNYRDTRAQNERRRAVYLALDRELTQMAETHGPRFQREMTQELNVWDTAISRGQNPSPPTFRLPGAERPPTGAWDAAVVTGSIQLIDPELFYELARFYNRADSAGMLYQRYSESAQTHIRPYLGDGAKVFWGPDGKPRPEVRVTIQRLRDFRQRQGELDREAYQLRAKLRRTAPR